MKKSNIILIILIVILTIALIIVTHSYCILREHAKTSFDSALSNADLLYEANKRVQELEEELEQYKNPSITTNVTNTVNTNKITSTEPYIPDGMQVADPNDNSGIKASDVKIDYDINKVKIEILKDTVKNTYAENIQGEVYLNNGDGSFAETPLTKVTFGKNLEWIYVCDMDGDGVDDIIPYEIYYDDMGNFDVVRFGVFIMTSGKFINIWNHINVNAISLFPGCRRHCRNPRTRTILRPRRAAYSYLLSPHLKSAGHSPRSCAFPENCLSESSWLPYRIRPHRSV